MAQDHFSDPAVVAGYAEGARRQLPGLDTLHRVIDQVSKAVEALATRLPILTPEEDEALLREAGFARVDTYYTVLTLRGWLAYA